MWSAPFVLISKFITDNLPFESVVNLVASSMVSTYCISNILISPTAFFAYPSSYVSDTLSASTFALTYFPSILS